MPARSKLEIASLSGTARRGEPASPPGSARRACREATRRPSSPPQARRRTAPASPLRARSQPPSGRRCSPASRPRRPGRPRAPAGQARWRRFRSPLRRRVGLRAPRRAPPRTLALRRPSTNQPLESTLETAASRSLRCSCTPRARSLKGIGEPDGTGGESTACDTCAEGVAAGPLITGIGGQDGSFLAELLLEQGYEVFGVVRRAPSERYENLERDPRPDRAHPGRPARRALAGETRSRLPAARGLQPRLGLVRADVLEASRS